MQNERKEGTRKKKGEEIFNFPRAKNASMSFVPLPCSRNSHSTYDDGIRPFFYGWSERVAYKIPCSKGFVSRIQVFFFFAKGTRPSCFVYFLFSTRGFFSILPFVLFSLIVCPLLKTLCVCDAVWVTFFSELVDHLLTTLVG